MGLEEDIRNRFLTDTEQILEQHLDDVDEMFRFYEDGDIELLDQYQDLRPQTQILLFLIARRYQHKAGLVDQNLIPYDEIYPVFPDKDKSTVRGYFMDLREDKFAKKEEDGHRMVVERLSEAIDRIESEASDA